MYLENCLFLFQSCEKNGLNAFAKIILDVRVNKLRRINSGDCEADKFSTRICYI